MKKFNSICGIVLAASILYLCIFVILKDIQGERVSSPYLRFQKMGRGDNRTFNWTALLMPVQIESDRTVTDTMHFTHRVIYPIAPQFAIVEPFDKRADTLIAKEIASVIADSLRSIELRPWPLGNLDGQSIAVRQYVHPEPMMINGKSSINLSLTGTASPEAEKYGFEASIEPGSKEKENEILAMNRLNRTKNLLLRKLRSDGITLSQKPELHSEELQLSRIQKDSVLKGHKEILDRMRYVDAEVQIVKERSVVTYATSPILLPLLLLLLGLLSRIRFAPTRIPTMHQRESLEPASALPPPPKEPFDWKSFWVAIGALGVIALLIYLRDYLFWILLGLLILLTLFLAVRNRKVIGEIIEALWLWLRGIWYAFTAWIRRWWPRRAVCRRIVVGLLLSLLLNIILLILLF